MPELFMAQLAYNGTVTMLPSKHVKKHGSDFGLMVLINQLHNDYAYSMHSNVGTRVFIHDFGNFPDHISSSLQQKFIGIGEEMFLTMIPLPVHGSETMRQYSLASRDCAFAGEITLVYGKFVNVSHFSLYFSQRFFPFPVFTH